MRGYRPATSARKVLLALTVLIAAVGSGVWFFHFRENFDVVVESELYRSAQPNRQMLADYARRRDLKSVINLRGDWPGKPWYEEEIQAAEDLGLAFYDLSLMTHKLTSMDNVRRLIEIFDKCPKPVLIHCRQGADRTSLAAALYLVLNEGKTPAEALDVYRLKYGHTGLAWGRHLPHLFDCYEEWLSENGRSHSAERFREWVDQTETVGYFASEIREVEPLNVRVGEPIQLSLEATNVSRYRWKLTAPHGWGIHLLVRAMGSDGGEIAKVRAGAKPQIVAPGASVRFKAELPPIESSGRYHLRAELVDSHGIRFGAMGDARWTADIIVPDATPIVQVHRPPAVRTGARPQNVRR